MRRKFLKINFWSIWVNNVSSKGGTPLRPIKFFCALKFFSRPIYMKELNLLFPTIPNFSLFDTEKCRIDRFENWWSQLGQIWGNFFEIDSLRHLVVQYRWIRYVFRLNRTCFFQPDGFQPRLSCLTSWLNWFFTLNHGKQFYAILWHILYDSYNMSHLIYNVMMTQWFRYYVIMT